jgi:gamma-glutamylcyclotransferase (GGCT)/AIG2-like uncharacterized protein YtfP
MTKDNNQYELFFIYGTLKNNFHNNYVLKDNQCNFLEECETIDKYPLIMLREPFPYLIDNKGIGKKIKGELYLVPKENIDNLDYFEGVPTLYKKGKIKIKTTTSQTIKEVNVYFKATKTSLEGKFFLEIFE